MAGKRASKNARKRRSINLVGRGSEIRLPAVPSVHVGWRWFSALLLVATVMAIYTLWTAPQMQVVGVELEGFERLRPEEIGKTMGILNKPIFLVDRNAVSKRLLDTYWELTAARVTVRFPAKVIIQGSERQPVLLWRLHNSDSPIWVDWEGVSFPARGEINGLVSVVAMAPPPDPIPDVQFDENGEMIEEKELLTRETRIETVMRKHQIIPADMVQAILTLGAHAPQNTDLLYDPYHGLGWIDPNENWQVYFGSNANDMTIKLNIYAAIVQELKAKSIKPELINLEYLHAPYYRLKR
jgi:hypothetical protein